jgi:hypothetical protein
MTPRPPDRFAKLAHDTKQPIPVTLARTAALRQSAAVTDRTEIHSDGTFNDQTGDGGWGAVNHQSPPACLPCKPAALTRWGQG